MNGVFTVRIAEEKVVFRLSAGGETMMKSFTFSETQLLLTCISEGMKDAAASTESPKSPKVNAFGGDVGERYSEGSENRAGTGN